VYQIYETVISIKKSLGKFLGRFSISTFLEKFSIFWEKFYLDQLFLYFRFSTFFDAIFKANYPFSTFLDLTFI